MLNQFKTRELRSWLITITCLVACTVDGSGATSNKEKLPVVHLASSSSHVMSGFQNAKLKSLKTDTAGEEMVMISSITSYEEDPYKTIIINNASFSHLYSGQVNASVQYMFVYNYKEVSKVIAMRVSLTSNTATDVYPVTIVARQQENINAWMLPMDIGNSYSYWSVGRTLCPVDQNHKKHIAEDQVMYITVASMSEENRDFNLTAQKIDDFEIEHDVPITKAVWAGRPKYYMYSFPDGMDSVMLRVTSESTTCMTVSVQTIKCPVFDLDTNVQFDGKYQTMSTQSSMFLQRADYEEAGGFYVVLITQPDDSACTGYVAPIRFGKNQSHIENMRSKTIDLIVTDTLSASGYYKAIFAAFGFFLIFYVLVFIQFCICKGWGLPKTLVDLTPEDLAWTRSLLGQGQSVMENGDSSGNEDQFFNRTARHESYGSIGDDSEDSVSNHRTRGHRRELSQISNVSAQIDESTIDFLPDAEHEKDIIRTKTALFVSDLARKKPRKLAKHYKMFYWNLLTVAIFYGLPVVQLVLTYQLVLYESGNEDLCYYNFDCAHPLLSYLSAFNNVYSNIGYVMLGLLFILIVRWRDVQSKRLAEQYEDLMMKFGIPQHFGLFYAMGVALMMEGFMSACYHVCPSYNNFQFDTSFMYIIACLLMLKIYQCRHPDINAKAHVAFFSMALIILIAVLGVVYGSNIFWILYALIHMLVSLVLTAQIYYMGRWSIDRYIFKRIFLVIISDFRRCSRPTYPNRFCLLLFGNIVNWGFAIYGAVSQPDNFASFFLAIFIGNVLLYIIFYLVMKLWSRERLSWLVVVVILTSTVTWTFSLYFFFQNLTTWQKTPAGSREGNRDCILMDFYDAHDVWHFLSAISLFFSFLVLLLLDDDLAQTNRDKIPVF